MENEIKNQLKSNPITSHYTLHKHQLTSVHLAKYLGVTIDSTEALF